MMYHRPADYPSSSPNENGAAIGANSGGVVGGGTGEGVVQGTRVRKRKWDLEGAPRSNKWDVPGPSASSPMTGAYIFQVYFIRHSLDATMCQM